MKSIFKEADEIVNKRSEEKEREYGPFSEGMERAAKIASGCTGKELEARDVFLIFIALKLFPPDSTISSLCLALHHALHR